jgi:serine/threonine-protein kinase
MLPALSDDPRFEAMFQDEARIASGIRHPNVVEILDLGEQDGVLYLVMEWVDGEPLGNLRRDAVRHGGMPLSVAVRIISDACAGLHAAHELKDPHTGETLGLVHRDISPQNVLVTFSGVVKVVDFGVAKAAGRSSEKTSAGQVKGKPPYMSPEQALGDDVDRRTDIFALGIVLYQLTTGKHPFRGQSDLVTLHNIVSETPVVSPRAHESTIPKSLEAVILKALTRDVSARFQTMAEFEAALDSVAGDLPRARQQEVANFVQKMAGDRGEERRNRILQASVAAEERSTQASALIAGRGAVEPSTPSTGGGSVISQVSGAPPGRVPKAAARVVWALAATSALLCGGFGYWLAQPSATGRTHAAEDVATLSLRSDVPVGARTVPTETPREPGGGPRVDVARMDLSETGTAAPPSGPSGSSTPANTPPVRRLSVSSRTQPGTGTTTLAAKVPATARPAASAPDRPNSKPKFRPPPVDNPGF